MTSKIKTVEEARNAFNVKENERKYREHNDSIVAEKEVLKFINSLKNQIESDEQVQTTLLNEIAETGSLEPICTKQSNGDFIMREGIKGYQSTICSSIFRNELRKYINRRFKITGGPFNDWELIIFGDVVDDVRYIELQDTTMTRLSSCIVS